MGKDIKLNSAEWCDLVFEGKNKQYGAYKLRQSSSKRVVVAFIVMLIFVGLVAAIPSLVNAVKSLTKSETSTMDDTFELSKIPIEEQVPQENIIKEAAAPPPPPLKTTIKFTPPVITEDDKVTEDNQVKTQDDLKSAKGSISAFDVKGTDVAGAVDLRELQDHKVIVEEKEPEKPFTTVEQMPSFPGGEAEMQKFIRDNLKYPVVAQESGIQGRVTIRFVVTKEGKISEVTVLRGIDPSCDKEAVAVVKKMPSWIPGKQNGRAVPVYFTLPVVFRLQ